MLLFQILIVLDLTIVCNVGASITVEIRHFCILQLITNSLTGPIIGNYYSIILWISHAW